MIFINLCFKFLSFRKFLLVISVALSTQQNHTSHRYRSVSTQKFLNFLVDEHWEKELEAELQDFELVDEENHASGAASSSADWEKDVEDLLGDCDDLK